MVEPSEAGSGLTPATAETIIGAGSGISPQQEPQSQEPQAPVTGAKGIPEEPETLQRSPLEDVWPVEHTDISRQVSGKPIRTSALEPLEMQSDGEDARQVQGALASVAVGQPTDSSVELITPRRPRPKSSMQLTPSDDQKPLLTKDEIELAGNDVHAPPISAKSSLQRQPLAAKNKSGPADQTGASTTPHTERPHPVMIPTEIGPLPADLWELMGEKPPATLAQTAAAPPVVQAFTETGSEPQHAESPVGQLTRTSPELPALVQREVQIGQVDSSVRTVDQPGNETQTGQGQTPAQYPGQNQNQAGVLSPALIERLAREVYAQIKRRFNFERERLRKD